MDFLVFNADFPILSLLIFTPLAGVPLLFLLPVNPFAKAWALLVTVINAGLSLYLLRVFDRDSFLFQFAEHHPWIPSLDINYTLGIDGISLLLVLLTTLIMPLCVLCSWRYIQDRVREFMACILVMETAMLGVFMALDFVLFYIMWEAMLIPMFLLIGIWGGPRKIYAAVKFFLYTLTGSVMLPVAFIALYFRQEPHTFFIPALMGQGFPADFQILIFLAFFTAFAVKVPMFPFHTWLPAAHVEAPTAGSVLLASVLLKMGGYGFLRFCLPMTPQAVHLFGPYILALSIIGILYGGLTALSQDDMKKLVAYSSVGHMGFVTLGIFILSVRGLEGALLQMISHGISTGALFLCVGMIYERTHSRELSHALGIMKRMPIFITFLAVFCLSSFAFPGTNGFVGEFLILAGTFAHSRLLLVFAVPGAILAAAYMLRMLQKIMFGGVDNPDVSHLEDLDIRETLTLLPLLVFVFWIGLSPGPVIGIMHASVTHLLEQVQRGMAP
jgi:NADH-quinone oxidoreductase subunit M